MNVAPVTDTSIAIQPSAKIIDFIKTIKSINDAPAGIHAVIHGEKIDKRKSYEHKLYLSEDDCNKIKSLQTDSALDKVKRVTEVVDNVVDEVLLNLEDIYWLYEYIQKVNDEHENVIYFHEMFEGSRVILPSNKEIPRNVELEKRCQRLKIEQQNKEYYKMTKGVDNVRKKLPEDTIAYQGK